MAGFLAHIRSLSLPPKHVTRFLRTYAEIRGLPEAEVARIRELLG